MKISLIKAFAGSPRNFLPLLLWCFVALPSQAAQPAVNLTGSLTTAGACGDPARMAVLKQKILAAIRAEVLRRTSPEAVTVEESDLQIQACPAQMFFDSDFVIGRAEYDGVRDVTVFLLSPLQANNVPPLIVAVHKQRSMSVFVARHDLRSGQIVSMDDVAPITQSSGNVLLPTARLWTAGTNEARTDQITKGPSTANSHSPLLVKRGMPSELVVRGKNFKGSMIVIPLESGRLGEELRVRDPGTQNILRATVSNVNQLEQTF